MPEFAGFPPATQRFFGTLTRNNNRPWFERNRPIYENAVRGPMLGLVEALDVRLATFAPEIVGDPKRSVFRIHRDIRFSKDKSPYKTNAGCWFFHRDAGRGVGQDASGGAGYYFHIDAKTSFVAGGIWMPGRPALNKIRDAIVAAPRALPSILDASAFKRRFGGLDEEAMLMRVPRGYPADHRAATLLRYQSFTVGRSVPTNALRSPRLVAALARDFELMLPFVRWLNGVLGHPPATRRM